MCLKAVLLDYNYINSSFYLVLIEKECNNTQCGWCGDFLREGLRKILIKTVEFSQEEGGVPIPPI